MARRVIGIFSAEDSAELAQAVVLILVELLRMGHRVRVVDADPAHGHLSRIANSTGDWQATDFLSLLANNNLGARGWDITEAVATQQPERAYLDIVPVLPRGSALRPELLESPPLLGARRYLFLRERLTEAEPAVDLVLLLAPVGDNRLSRSLLAHGVDAAVFYACGDPKQVALLGQLRQTADALRGALIPFFCWEGRDGRLKDLGEYWVSYFHTDRRLSPAKDRYHDAPPPVLVLGDDEGQEVEVALAIRRLVQVYEPDPVERLHEADAEDWPEVAEGAFAELRAKDPGHARALFDADIAPRLGTLLSAVAATRAVWLSANAGLEEKRHYASITIQKFRLEAPNPQATFMAVCFAQLVEAAEADPNTRHPARLYINLAEALLHQARWRQVQGEDREDLPERAEALLLRASKMPRRPEDRRIGKISHPRRPSGLRPVPRRPLAMSAAYQMDGQFAPRKGRAREIPLVMSAPSPLLPRRRASGARVRGRRRCDPGKPRLNKYNAINAV